MTESRQAAAGHDARAPADATVTAGTAAAAPPAGRSLRQLLVQGERAVVAMLFLGFSSGLPAPLYYQTLSVWLRQDGVDLAQISMIALFGLVVSFKFLWAPLVDRVPLPLFTRLFGRRRGWMLLAQCGIVVGLLNLSAVHPSARLKPVALCSLFLAFCAATQDIAMDAWRIESVPEALQGAMAGAYQFGARIAILAGTGGALALAQVSGWHASYSTMAVLGAVGIAATLLAREPNAHASRASWEQEARVADFLVRNARLPPPLRHAGAAFVGAVVCPLTDFFSRFRFSTALLLLAFIGCYRLTDYTMGGMAGPFYIDHGYTPGQIATVVKTVGTVVSLAGVLLAGLVITRLGLVRALVLGSLAVMTSNVGFALLAGTSGPTLPGLGFVNGVDNLALALHGIALIAFMSILTSARYTATQYALFSSFYALPGKLLESHGGHIVKAIGFQHFFLFTASLSIPSLLLIYVLTRPRVRRELPA